MCYLCSLTRESILSTATAVPQPCGNHSLCYSRWAWHCNSSVLLNRGLILSTMFSLSLSLHLSLPPSSHCTQYHLEELEAILSSFKLHQPRLIHSTWPQHITFSICHDGNCVKWRTFPWTDLWYAVCSFYPLHINFMSVHHAMCTKTWVWLESVFFFFFFWCSVFHQA